MTVPARRSDLLALVTALDEGGVLTPVSLMLTDPQPDYDRMEALARYLGMLRDATAWWVADLILYAEATLGESAYQLDTATRRSEETLRRWVWVARAIPPVQRRTGLSFTHHEKVAKLAPAEQEAWLDRAEAQRWSSRDLAAAMKPEPPALPPRRLGGSPDLLEAARAVVRSAVRHHGSAVVPADLIDRLREAVGE